MTAALALLEVLERDGRVRRAVPVLAWPLTIGRAIDNDVVLDDPHVAPHHAAIEFDPLAGAGTATPGQARLRALPSVNGVELAQRRLAGGDSAALGMGMGTGAGAGAGAGGFMVGSTRLRLRLAGEALAPERALLRAPRHPVTLLLALLLWAWLLAEHAIEIDPGSRAADWMLPMLGVPVALALWCLLWALASKLFQHRFDFWPHLAVATRGLLAIEAVGLVLPWAGALTSWSGLSRISAGVAAACAVAMLVAHARLLLPNQRRALALGAAGLFVVGSGVVLALNQQRQDRWFAELYMATLPPPALLWVQPAALASFLAGAAALRARLEDSVRDSERESRAGRERDDE